MVASSYSAGAGAGAGLARSAVAFPRSEALPRSELWNDLVGHHTGEAAREGDDHGNEQSAHREQPELGERLGEQGLGPVHQQRTRDRADDGVPAADRAEDDHVDRRHDADEGRRHEPDLQGEHGPADARHRRRQAEHEDLVVGDVVARKADAILLVARGDQDAAKLAGEYEASEEHGAEQQHAADEIENVFRTVGPDVPTQQRAQIGDTVDAAGIALLADDQDRHHQRQRLGNDGKVDAADAPLEHGRAENEGQNRRHSDDGDQRERQ